MHASCIRLAVQCTQDNGAIVCNSHNNNNIHCIIYDIRPCYYNVILKVYTRRAYNTNAKGPIVGSACG